MLKTVILDGDEYNAFIKTQLSMSVGPIAVAGNYENVIENLVMLVVNPVKIKLYSSEFPQLGHYGLGLSEYELECFVEFMLGRIRQTLTFYFGEAIGRNMFSVEFDQDNSIYVIDLGLQSSTEQNDNEEFERRIINDIEDGHYVPEKLRRAVGY